MILDIVHRQDEHQLEISYIDASQKKRLLRFNASRFPTYYADPNGAYENWDGTRCSRKYTNRPSKFDIKEFIASLDDETSKLIHDKAFPRVYAIDIEVDSSVEFPKAEFAKYEIQTISIVNPECDIMVLGTVDIADTDLKMIETNVQEYFTSIDYFNELGLRAPRFQYVKFPREELMLKYFLTTIVRNASVITGWNVIFYDWQYICNRIKNYFPDLSINMASTTNHVTMKTYVDKYKNKHRLTMPDHTLILDMMDVITNHDEGVMNIKEGDSLNYFAYENLGVSKIEYDGTLAELYESDYPRFVFYNAIDSVLVQLLDKYFKTTTVMYLVGQYCDIKLGDCYSMIATTEALVFKAYFAQNKHVMYEERDTRKQVFPGAYVKMPKTGIHRFACCNDFASLYPTTILTCNMSFENFVGSFYDESRLSKYRGDTRYIVVGSGVFENAGTESKPKLGELLYRFVDERALDKYRNDKNYFISINGDVYRNDQKYTFPAIQQQLKADRNVSKYLGKELYAIVMSDVEHVINNNSCEYHEYDKKYVDALAGINYDIKNSNDISKYDLKRLKNDLTALIAFHESMQLTMKKLGNSMYGGSSHPAFYWFNIALAIDITTEAKNLTKMMESHFQTFWRDNWRNMTDWHKKWNITLNEDVMNKMTDADWDMTIYGDTDSIYSSYEPLLKTINGYETMSDEQRLDVLLKINLDFVDNHNNEYISAYYATRNCKSYHAFELETISLAGIWLDVKKRYAQILLWKDGRRYDMDKLPLKCKGMEVIKSSYPKLSRQLLKELIYHMFTLNVNDYFSQRMNIKMQELKPRWFEADIDDICGSSSVTSYFNSIGHYEPEPYIDKRGNAKTRKVFHVADENEDILMCECRTNAGVGTKGAYNYNRIVAKYKLKDAPIIAGKMKYYKYREGVCARGKAHRDDNVKVFAYPAKSYPKWADTYAPIDKRLAFENFVIDPFNRFLKALNMPMLTIDGALQLKLNLF